MSGHGPRRRQPISLIRNAIRALAALIVLGLVLVGIPLALALTIGNPSSGLQDLLAGDVSDSAVIAVLATVAWLSIGVAWAQFLVATVVETYCLLARIPIPRRIPGVLPSQQHMARALVTAVLVIVPALTQMAGAEAAQAAGAPPGRPTATAAAASPYRASASPSTSPSQPKTQHGAGSPTRPARDYDADRAGEAGARAIRHTVVAGGPATLWDLAESYLGDGQRWQEIWHLNEGRHQDDGAVMSRPGLVREGWVILIPDTDGTLAAEEGDSSVTVRPGDTLSEIADHHDTTWPALWKENGGRAEPGGKVFSDADHIEPGWSLNLPAAGNHRSDDVTTNRPDSSPDATAPTTPERAEPTYYRFPSEPSPTPSASTPTVAKPAVPATTGAPIPEAVPRATASDAEAVPTAPSSSSVVAVGLGCGGGLLAATALIALLRYRRRQMRYRRPGQTIAATPPELVAMEKTLLVQGSNSLADVAWLDQALRSLAQTMTIDGARLPDVLAVRMGEETLELILAEPSPVTPPLPWRVDSVTGRWGLRREDHTPDTREQSSARREQFAPYPTLASVGYTDEGDYWLLDLERIGSLNLTGDRDRCLDLARFLAAELAHNIWSEQLEVTLAGFGAEVTNLNPQRVTHHGDPRQALAELATQAQDNLESLASIELVDALEGRQLDVVADQWMPHVLLIDPAEKASASEANDLGLRLRESRTRSAVALVLAGALDDQDEWTLVVDTEGHVRIPALGLTLNAQQLPAYEADQLARLIAATASTDDRAVPPARGSAAWDALADAAGAPVPEITVARPEPPSTGHEIHVAPSKSVPDPTSIPAPRSSLGGEMPSVASPAENAPTEPEQTAAPIPAVPPGDSKSRADDEVRSVVTQPTAEVLATTATSEPDLQVLSPGVTRRGRQQIEDADPGLDADLAAWRNPETEAPRLSLLGPMQVRAGGELPPDRPREPWHTEVVAFLAVHPRGVTAEQYRAAMWPQDRESKTTAKVRQSLSVARKWLGRHPETHRSYLPNATEAGPNGMRLYRIDGIVIDAELFCRLRLRGVARGADGLDDLEAALAMVTGPPFDQRRSGGYAWLADLQLDYQYIGMIVDVAHLVATCHLAAGRPDQAAAAARVSLLAGSLDDIPLLDLVAACDAQGNHGEAAAWVRKIMLNHDAEVEEDLPPRTAEILHRRRWIDRPR